MKPERNLHLSLTSFMAGRFVRDEEVGSSNLPTPTIHM